jgi:glycosyltransferase involved in cell wall biosynthesis
MKIAVWHNLPSGGGKRALYHHIKGLIERGHTVESWCPPTADRNYLPLSELITEHIIPFDYQQRKAQASFGLNLATYYNIADKIVAMDRHCQQCADEINAGDFDLLFANSCTFFRTTSIGRYLKKIPKILYLQEPFRWLYEALPKLPWAALPVPKEFWRSRSYLRQFFNNLIELQGLRIQVREELLNARSFDTILVNSFFSRESVLRAYGLDSKVCYLGVDTEMFQPTGVVREKFVVGLGGIYYGKGIERAIESVAAIELNKRPDLIWIGNFADDRDRAKLQALAASRKVNLIFKVGISDEELVDLLNRASVMIYTPRLEPFGFAPLEANACETPVVAIAEGGIRETIQNSINGILIQDNDPTAVGEAILHILENPELADQMGKRAREYVLAYWSWDSAIDRLEKRFFELLNK